MKRNSLFINVFLFFICAFIGATVYSFNNSVDGTTNIIFDNSVLLPALIVCGGFVAISIILSIPFGRIPKKASAKVDMAIILCLLIIIGFAAIEACNSILDNKYFNNDFKNIFHYFMIGGVCYFAFLALVCILKLFVTLLFKKDLSDVKLKRELSLIVTGVLILGGVLGLFVRAFYLAKTNQIESWKSYFYIPSMYSYLILIAYSVLAVATHALTSIKTKNFKDPIISAIIYIIIAVAIQLVFVTFNDKIPFITESYKDLEIVAVVACGGYGLVLVILLISYLLRPFTLYIFNLNNEEKTVVQTIDETKFATREDFILVSEALARSNHYRRYDDNSSDKEKKNDTAHYETELVTTISKGFKAKLITAPDDIKECYSNLLNVANKYKKGHARHSFSKDTILVGREKVAILKISPSSKALYLYLNLPESYLEDNKYHLKNFKEKKSYEDTPLRLRIRSERSQKYALELLDLAFKNVNAIPYKKEREVIDYTKDLGLQTDDQMIENGLIKKKVVEETYLVEPVYEDVDVKNEDESSSTASSSEALPNEDSSSTDLKPLQIESENTQQE